MEEIVVEVKGRLESDLQVYYHCPYCKTFKVKGLQVGSLFQHIFDSHYVSWPLQHFLPDLLEVNRIEWTFLCKTKRGDQLLGWREIKMELDDHKQNGCGKLQLPYLELSNPSTMLCPYCGENRLTRTLMFSHIYFSHVELCLH
jgi:hypothetical protein